MSLVVKYHNDLNQLSMRSWTSDEMNMFFAIMSKLRDEGTKEITFDTNEIKKIIKFKRREKARWEKVMIGVSEKVSDLKYRYEDDKVYEIMTLFTYFKVDKEKQELTVEVNDRFKYILNDLSYKFTYYRLDEFVNVRRTYAKTAYRLFKQWKTIGKVSWDIEDFKKIFDIPESYGVSNIDKRAIKPIIEELTPFFKGLKSKKIKANTKGNPVIGYEFTWKPEKTGQWVNDKYTSDKWYTEQLKNAPQTSEPVPMVNWLEDN